VKERFPHALPLIVIGLLVGGAMVAIGLGIDWLPIQASQQAGRTDDLLWFVFWSSAAVFTIVVTFLLYSVIRFRAQPGDESDGPPIHGNTFLEVVWTAIPAALLVVLSVYSYFVLSDNEALAKNRMTIDVTAEQFAWSFTYPDLKVETGDLRVPVNRQIYLRLISKDVIHDFWVNETRLKADVVPGITNHLIIDPNRVGTYEIVCAELCGVGHNVMRSRMIVMSQSAYDAWARKAALVGAKAGA
jgi:cytochrome c oxidase subunit 2